jgi:hypothetical protein
LAKIVIQKAKMMRRSFIYAFYLCALFALLPLCFKLYWDAIHEHKHKSLLATLTEGLGPPSMKYIIPFAKVAQSEVKIFQMSTTCNNSAFLLLNCEDGFNNQVVCIMDAMAFGKALNRTVVIPKVNIFSANNPLAIDGTRTDFSNYFNVALWRSHGLCAITMDDFLEMRKKTGKTDKPKITQPYRLHHLDTRFMPVYFPDIKEAFEKDVTVSGTTITIDSSSYLNDSEIVSLLRDHRSSPLDELDLFFLEIMYLEYNFVANPKYFASVYGVMFNSILPNITEQVLNFISNVEHGLAGSKYIAMHIRRGEWWHDQCTREQKNHTSDYDHCNPSLQRIESIMQNMIEITDAKFVFVLTNDATELAPLKDKIPIRLFGDMVKLFSGGNAIEKSTSDQTEQLIIDMLIAAHANYFVGNLWSTFSGFIHHQRSLLGHDDRTSLWW